MLDHANRSQQRVRLASPTSWIKAAVACGFDIAPLFQEAGIADSLATDAMPLIEVNALAHLMQRCVDEAAPQHHFPLVVGEHFAFDAIPSLETFLATSASVRVALLALEWAHVVLPMLSIKLVENQADASAALVIESAMSGVDATVGAYFVEKDMTSVSRFARDMLGDKAEGQRIDFRHDPGRATVRIIEEKHGLPVQVNQSRNAVIFHADLLDMPLSGGLSALNQRARAQVETQLPPRLDASAAEWVERWLLQEPALLSAPLSLFAQRMNMHPRALQRRLDLVGQPFAALRDRCRQRLAQDLLQARDSRTSFEDIAALLGYSDRHSFTRAFKRWTGKSPRAWRDSVI